MVLKKTDCFVVVVGWYSVLGGASLSLVESPDPPLGRVTEPGEKVGVPAKHPPGLLHVGGQPGPRLLGSSNPPSLSPLLHTSLLGDIVSRYTRFTQVQHSCLQCSSSLWRHREAYDVTSVNCMPFIEVSGRR